MPHSVHDVTDKNGYSKNGERVEVHSKGVVVGNKNYTSTAAARAYLADQYKK